MAKNKAKKLVCGECEAKFTNAGGFAIHKKKMHPPPPPPPEPVITFDRVSVEDCLPENHTLIGSETGTLEVGDVFYTVHKHTVLRIERKKVDGVLDKKEVKVLAKVTKRHWQPTKPL